MYEDTEDRASFLLPTKKDMDGFVDVERGDDVSEKEIQSCKKEEKKGGSFLVPEKRHW